MHNKILYWTFRRPFSITGFMAAMVESVKGKIKILDLENGYFSIRLVE